MKTQAAEMSRKYERLEAALNARQPQIDAIVNDSILMAELETLAQAVRIKQYATEYALLGIVPGATNRGIKNAYRRQAHKLHPDKGGDAEAFKQMLAAYRRRLASMQE